MREEYPVHYSGILLLLSSILSLALTLGRTSRNSSELYFFFIILSLPVIASMFIRFRIGIHKYVEFIIAALLFIPVLMINNFLKIESLFLPFLHVFGIYFTVLSIFVLYKVKRRVDLMNFYFMTAFILIISGLSMNTFYFESFVIFHFILFTFYFRNLLPFYYKPVKTEIKQHIFIRLTGVFITGIVIFFLFNSFVYWLEPATNFMILPASSGMNYLGLVNETGLNVTGTTKLSEEVVLRVYSDYEPHRLRSKVYTEYINTKWKTYPEKVKVLPQEEENIKPSLSYEEEREYKSFIPTFSASIPDSKKVSTFKIMVKPGVNTVFFTVPSTIILFADLPRILTDQYGIFYPAQSLEGMNYSLAAMKNSDMVSCAPEEDFSTCLTLPVLSPGIASLAKEITSNLKNDYARCIAVESFFHDNFEYSLKFKPKGGIDPVEEFILNRSSAHCEYFATGMVFLLRSIGIPARYVTGFLVHEYNQLTDYYIVRERDAHAWVEAFIPGKGWVTFDPTPPGGEFERLMGPSEPGVSSQIADFLMFKLEKIKDLFIKGNYIEMISFLWAEIKKGLKWIYERPLIPGIFIIIFLVVLFRKKLYSVVTPGKKMEILEVIKSPELKKLHGMLKRFDRFLKKHGIKRKENLTLYEFSRYLKEEPPEGKEMELCHRFIDSYCKLRYGSSKISEEDLIDMENHLNEVERLRFK